MIFPYSCYAGPVKQVKQMFAAKRWIATSVYVCSVCACFRLFEIFTFPSLRYLFFLILTIIFATVKSDSLSTNGRVAAVIVCLIFQVLALAWYVLSYIPFGRDMVKKCFGC